MENATPSPREQLIAAFEQADERTRGDRVTRAEWLAQHRRLPGIVFGRTETMRVLSEAADTFVNGHFVASLVLATAFIEHALMEELQDQGLVSGSCTFEQAIQYARTGQVLEAALLQQIDDLRLKRNPFTHLKKDGHAHSMGTRFRVQKVHPLQMIEADAKEALKAMYAVFFATLKQMS